MLRKILLPFLFLVLSTNCFAQNEYKVAAIAFYNCENLYDTLHDPKKKDEDFTPNGSFHYTGEIYRQKLHNIAVVIERLGTDVTADGPAVIGLAEVENDQVLGDLVGQPEIKNRHYKYACFYTPDERGHGTALLYNPKYLKVLNAAPIHVPTEALPAKRPARDILYVNGILSGDTVHFFVNNWPSMFGGEPSAEQGRMLAASICKKLIDSLLNISPDSKIILLGDFNDNPNSDNIIKTLSAKAHKNQVAQNDLFNPWINLYKNGLGTESYHDEWYLTDQIMVSGAFIKSDNNKWKYLKAEIYNKEYLMYNSGRYKGLPHRSFTPAHVWDNGYSDHFPVVMYFVEKK